jgi:hypothetical protein
VGGAHHLDREVARVLDEGLFRRDGFHHDFSNRVTKKRPGAVRVRRVPFYNVTYMVFEGSFSRDVLAIYFTARR